MKKLLYSFGLVFLLLPGLFIACAPQTAPTPTQATSGATAPTPLPATAAAPQLSPEEAEWSKVVEAAKKERTITLYAYSWVGDAGIMISKAFKNKYGIDLEIITGRGAEFVERLKTEKRMGRMTGDIFESSPTHLNSAKNANTLMPSAPGLPALREKGIWAVEPLFQDKEGYILTFMPLVGAPYVNTNLVKSGQEPKSWADIFQPRWKG